MKGLHDDPAFGSLLAQSLGGIENGSDLLSQLAALLQAGTPPAKIVDHAAKDVADALKSATGNQSNADRRSTLQRALAGALAPPGTSPPSRAETTEVSDSSKVLESRLGSLLSQFAREIPKTAGQQNRFSGAVLDAKSAREIPAQHANDTTGAPRPAGDPSRAESSPPAPQTSAPPNILSRMLTRAAAAGAQRTDGPPRTDQVIAKPMPAPAASASAAPTHAGSPPSATPSASDLFSRLTTVIAQSSNQHAARDDGKHSQDLAFAKIALAQIHHAQSASASGGTPAFSTAVTSASASASQTALPATPYLTVDPQSVIDQVVKGIVMRNFGSTSEVRMRLQPEHLGDVSLKLTVTGNTITATMVAQNADVRDMLLANQQHLARSLAEAGLSLGKFSVDVSGGNSEFTQQQSQQHRSFGKPGALRLASLAEDESWADSRFGPPIVAGSKSLVLNYLV